MNLEQVKDKLIGHKIVGVEADEWDEEFEWLKSLDSVYIVRDNGTKLDSIGEPIVVRGVKLWS